jgi:hypothetical protein
MKFPIVIKIVSPGDARGWIGLGCFVLACVVLAMASLDKALLDNNAFLVLATAIIITGWVNGPVSWAYAATKTGGEAAESSARIAEQAATAALPTIGQPAEVKIINPPDDPANVTETKGN